MKWNNKFNNEFGTSPESRDPVLPVSLIQFVFVIKLNIVCIMIYGGLNKWKIIMCLKVKMENVSM